MAIIGVLVSTGTALANNPPSGQTFLSMVSILPLTIIFSMLGWGMTALTRGEKPAHLTGARPWRLIPCSMGLMIIMVFLVGLSIVFTGSLVREYKYQDLEENLKNFVSYQMAYAREQKAQTGHSRFDKSAREVYFKAYPHARVEYSPDNEKFTVVVPPEYVPVFPYNYMTAMPSYRSDETGQIRMIRVRSKNHLCPADAPVIMKIDAQDLQQLQRAS